MTLPKELLLWRSRTNDMKIKPVYYYKLVVVGQHGTMWSSNVSKNEYEEIEKNGRKYLGTDRCLRYRLRQTTIPTLHGYDALFLFSTPEECIALKASYPEGKKHYILKGLAENPIWLPRSPYRNTVFTSRNIPGNSIICTAFTPISIYARL